MKKFIILLSLINLSSFNLWSSSTVDQAIAFQHEDAGFDADDFDRDKEVDNKVVMTSDEQNSAKYSSWHDVLDRAINSQREEAGIESNDLSDDSGIASDRDSDSRDSIDQGFKKGSSWVDWIQSKLSSSLGRSVENAIKEQQLETGLDPKDLGQKLDEPVRVVKLNWSELISDDQRIAYLKNELSKKSSAMMLSGREQGVLCHLIKDFSDREMDQFIDNIAQRSKEKNYSFSKDSYGVFMNDISNAYADLRRDNESLVVKWGKVKNWGDEDFNAEDYDNYYEANIAYHEAGHALVQALIGKNRIVSYGTVISTANNDGHVSVIPSNTWSPLAINEKQFHEDKNEIMQSLAGPIAEKIFDNNERDKGEFLDTQFITGGGGSPSEVGSDLHHAYEKAKEYCRNKRIDSDLYDSPEPEEEEVNAVLGECYEQVYDLLLANKAKLDVMAKRLYTDKIVSDDIIHEIAGSPKLKYIYEDSIGHSIARMGTDLYGYTHKRMAFYDRNQPHN